MTQSFKKELALKILNRNYPVSRIKINKKFRRAIVCDNGIAYPLDKECLPIIKKQLIMSLYTCLGFEIEILNAIVEGYLSFD